MASGMAFLGGGRIRRIETKDDSESSPRETMFILRGCGSRYAGQRRCLHDRRNCE